MGGRIGANYPALTQAVARERVTTAMLDNYIPVPECGCWLWIGGWNQGGYGAVHSFRGKWNTTAHRLLYAFHLGDIPEGMMVCHKCDTPACVNPDHLFLGTNFDNMRDMARKGRGAEPVTRRLTAEQALEIYSSTKSQCALAREYGVSQASVRYIKIGKSWRGVTGHREQA